MGQVQEFPWPQLITNLYDNSGDFNKIDAYIENYCCVFERMRACVLVKDSCCLFIVEIVYS